MIKTIKRVYCWNKLAKLCRCNSSKCYWLTHSLTDPIRQVGARRSHQCILGTIFPTPWMGIIQHCAFWMARLFYSSSRDIPWLPEHQKLLWCRWSWCSHPSEWAETVRTHSMQRPPPKPPHLSLSCFHMGGQADGPGVGGVGKKQSITVCLGVPGH